MGKKSFILHIDSLSVLDELTDAQAGKLFKAIKEYHLRDAERCYQDGDTGFDKLMEDFLTRVVFAPFKAQFDRDEESYNDISEKRREAGRKGGAPKGNKNANKQNQAKQANASKNKQNKLSDSVSDSDKENNYNNLSLVSFDSFWDSYDKKVGRPKCEKKWESLSQKEKIEAMLYIPEYVKSQPDKKFRKNPETFLNQKSWNDEIIISDGKSTSIHRPAYQSTAERIREESARHIQGIAARLSSGATLPDSGDPDVF